ncbi:hypothetical protein PLESTB_001284900 [Pleodorina starrii]|uniref:Targeting protein for Xklp2 n=1 Tax=Pleodorina starrii TaxID=330485 RepID=A0A9W6BSY0_9CHLO|nr:hypothetical protein PLESTB_001284900 [Pleodorina starrii]
MELDQRYEEYAAPKIYRDLSAASPGSVNSSWFASHDEYEDFNQAQGAVLAPLALADISNTEAATAHGAAEDGKAKPEKKRSNIVTSWGPGVVKKRKTEEGAFKKGEAKAAKQNKEATVGPAESAPAPKAKRSKAAGAESRHEAAKEARQGHALGVVRPIKKSKAGSGKACGALTAIAGLAAVAAKEPRRVMPARSTKITMPAEFELATSKRAEALHHGKEHQDDGSPYKPLVLRVKEFNKTPGRFKRNPDEPLPSKPLQITEAKEPQLLTTARIRPSVFKPREVVEAEEMAQMPVFRASTLNPLILSTSGQIGVPKVDKRETTAPQPFNFVTDDRAEARAARMQKQELQLQAKQKYQPGERQTESDAEGGDGREKAERSLPAKARKSVAFHNLGPAIARSPMLHTKFRAREVKREEERYEFHARPVPKYLSVPSLELPRGHHWDAPPEPTRPEPFRLATEERGVRHRTQLETRRSEEEKAAARARIPRAHGLPLSTDVPLVPPKPEARRVTVPEQFNLISELRHSKYEEQRRRELEEEEAAKRAEAAFKARPMWNGIPFRVHDTDLPITVPEPMALCTSARAATREEFNKHVEDKMKEAEARARQAEEEKKREEEEERRQLRKAAVFRAMPMPDLSAPPAANPPPAPKPTTVPKSPALAVSRRKRRKSGKGRKGGDA